MQQAILRKVESYLKTKLGCAKLALRQSEADEEMAEVLVDGEFVGTLYRDMEDMEMSFDFNMSILEADLE